MTLLNSRMRRVPSSPAALKRANQVPGALLICAGRAIPFT